MAVPIIKGERVLLRPARESDIDDRLAIGRHDEFEHMCGGERLSERLCPDRAHWATWYGNQLCEPCAFVIEYEGHCIGSARFHNISETDRSARYAVGIFDPALYGRGLGTEVTQMMLRYGFDTLGFHRIELLVLDYNPRGIRCYEKCGFRRDGVLRENAFIDGQWHSDVVMSILEDEYRTALSSSVNV